MNTLAETNRNIGLLETSITMQSFSAVAMETQADAAELMIRDEGSRKDAIIDHLFELHAECLERMAEVNELSKSANDEYSFYVKEAWENTLRNDRESAQICQDLAEKALDASKAYVTDWQKLYELSTQILATIRGEDSPRLLPVANQNADDLPFESAKHASEDVMATFDRLVKMYPDKVVDYVVKHRDIRAQDDDSEVQEVLAEIRRNRVSAEDVLQSLDEVLAPEYAEFFEALNTEYAVNPAKFNAELADCIEAYAA